MPEPSDSFGTSSDGDFYIEFELETKIAMNRVKILSIGEGYMKSFDLSVEGKIVKSVKEATGLNGRNKSMTGSFPKTCGRKVRLTQTGQNWDKNDNFVFIKGIEIMSPEDKYSKRVFAALAAESENNDPRRCPVIISAKWYDHNRFHSINSKSITSTYPWKNFWFQVELTKGVAILYGFRLKKNNSSKLKSYKLICTDDSSKPESAWTTLIEINEKSENEHENIYEF